MGNAVMLVLDLEIIGSNKIVLLIKYYTLLRIMCTCFKFLRDKSASQTVSNSFIHISLDQPRAQALTKYMGEQSPAQRLISALARLCS